MMKLGAWLGAMAQPLVAKVLLALGFQVVTLTGVSIAIGTLRSMFLAHMGEVGAAGLNMALLAGVGEAFGLIFGAIAFKVALWQIQSATKILGVNS